LERILGRLIHTESAGKDRTQLVKAVALAIRELMRQTEISSETRDLAAFIALALDEIARTIDLSVAAWEKRGYWVKADRFRMEWLWSEHSAKTMREAVLAEDWPAVAGAAAAVAQRLGEVKIPQRHRMGEPWHGAREQLNGK
jgi:hypothetical protein